MFSLMRNKNQCYCAFCKSSRRIYAKRTLSFLNILEALAASLGAMFLIWQQFNPRFVLFFAGFLALGEMFIKIRWRSSTICPLCGFDPVMYKASPEKAAARVKEHLEIRKANPNKLLARSLNLPAITPQRAKILAELDSQKKTESRGGLLSRQI